MTFSQYLNFKIEDEIDLSTTGSMMQLQNNSDQREMETLKKAQYIYFRTVSYYEQLLRPIFQSFYWQKINLIFENIAASELKSRIE